MTQTPATEAPGDQPAPPEPSRPRPRVLRRVLIVVASVLVLAVAATLVYGYTVQRSVTKNITRGLDLPTDQPSSDPSSGESAGPAEPQETGTLNYVLLGSDSRDPDNEGNGRSDSIMIVHLNKQRTKAYIISFPRDMYVTIPGYGKNKINAAYSFGGPTLTVRTLQNLVDVKMNHVVLVDFEGFIQLTEDLGGVTVTNKTAFSSHGFDYPKGKVTVQGEKALWFVRERHSLPGGDLDRAENQRNVIKAIVTKGLSAEVISDPTKFTKFIANMSKHLTVDNSLGDAEIRRTALSLRLSGKDIELLQAPLAGFGTAPDGQSIDVVDTAKLAELSRALKKDDLADYVKKYPKG
jgi:LCP family protein required for cell wall assembly